MPKCVPGGGRGRGGGVGHSYKTICKTHGTCNNKLCLMSQREIREDWVTSEL